MSERKVDLDTTGKGENITPAETREQKVARRAQIYNRGVLGDRLHVDLPPEIHGEWVPNNVVDIERKRGLGFEIDTEHAKNRALHDKGDGASYVGDVVFMTCSREDKEIIDEIRRKRYNDVHAPKGNKQLEERNFLNSNSTVAGAGVGSTSEGSALRVKGTDISAALNAASKQ